MLNDVISWENILAMTACIVALVTWLPAARRVFSPEGTRIHYLAAGIVSVCFGTFIIRGYSLLMREWNMVWLRDHYTATIAVGIQCLAMCLLAYAYFAPSNQSHLTPTHYNGVWAGGFVLAILVTAKVIF